MMTFSDLASVPSDPPAPFTDQLRLAVAACLARFKGSSREHTESDLRCCLAWCAGHGLDPLAAQRPHLELYIRWMQEIRRFKPSTVFRRFSVTAGFYRTCALDGILQHSPAEHVRRPAVPRRITHARVHAPAVRGPAHRRPGVCEPVRFRTGGHARAARLANLRSHRRGHRRPRRGTRPPGPAGMRQGHQGRAGAAAASSRPGHRPGKRLQGPRADPAEYPRLPDGPARRTRPCATSPRPPASRSPRHTRTCSATTTSRPCSTLALTCATCRSLPGTPTRAPGCGTRTLGNFISWERNRRSAGHSRVGIAFGASGRRLCDQASLQSPPV